MTFTGRLGAGWRVGVGALLLGSGGCRSDSYSRLVTNNFDEQWEVKAGVSSEQAHSGSFAAKAVGPTDTLRLHYLMQTLGMTQRLRLSAQVWLAHSPSQYPTLVVQLWRNGGQVYTKYLWLNRVVWRYDQWVPISLLLQLPPPEPQDELRIWLALNQPDTKVYLDDLTLDSAQ